MYVSLFRWRFLFTYIEVYKYLTNAEERVAMVINAKNGNMLHTNKVDITLFVFPVYLYYLFSSSNVHTRVRLVACPTSVYTGEWMGL